VLRDGQCGVWSCVGGRTFFSPEYPDWLWGPPSLLALVSKFISPGVKQPRHEGIKFNEGDHSPPFVVEVVNEWSCTSAPSVCLHGMDRDNCTFTCTSLHCVGFSNFLALVTQH